MKTTLGNQDYPGLNHPKTSPVINEPLAPPSKSLGFRFCTYLVLWSFFFQTIWPSVAFAEDLLHVSTWQKDGIIHKRAYLSIGAYVDNKFEEGGGELFRSQKPPRIEVEYDPSGINKRQAFRNLKAALEQSLELKALYPNLEVKHDGLFWSDCGVSFFMAFEGRSGGVLKVFKDTKAKKDGPKKPYLRLFNPHGDIVLGPDLNVNYVQAKARNVFMKGNSAIPNLEVWALGGKILENPSERTAERGQFTIPLESSLKTSFLTLREGLATIDGTLALTGKDAIINGVGNKVTNNGTFKINTRGADICDVSDFENNGTIKGWGLTLTRTRFNNCDSIVLRELMIWGDLTNNGKVLVTHRFGHGGRIINVSGNTFEVRGNSFFYHPDIQNRGRLLFSGNSQGAIEAFGNQGSLSMGTVSDLTVTEFESPGSVDVAGPMKWSGGRFKTTRSTVFHGKSALSVESLETDGTFSALEELALRGSWHHKGGVATFSKGCEFDVDTITSHGALNLLGDNRGSIQSFISNAPLVMDTVSDLKVRTFLGSGGLETTGPVSWIGDVFKTSKTTFIDKTRIVSRLIETQGPLSAETELELLGEWDHQGQADIARLAFQGPSLRNGKGAKITVGGFSTVDTDVIDNDGQVTWKGSVTGRIGQLLNHSGESFLGQGGMIFRGNAKLQGTRIANSGDFSALAVFDWVGEVLENTTRGRMGLFNNQVVASQQVLNHGLLLWTHNMFQTGHFLNLGWGERNRDLTLSRVMPVGWQTNTNQSTTIQTSTLENRSTLKLAPADYTPLMTIGDINYAQWLNDGALQLPATTFDDHTRVFKNTGNLLVEGDLRGRVDSFESTKKAILKGAVDLTGNTFTSTGEMTLEEDSTIRAPRIVTGADFTAQKALTMRGDWTHQAGKADIAKLFFEGRVITNHSDILIRELPYTTGYFGSVIEQTITTLNNGDYNTKDRDQKPLFRIMKGGALLHDTTNWWGTLVLEEGTYKFEKLCNIGKMEVDTFQPEGSGDFKLTGTTQAKHFYVYKPYGSSSRFGSLNIINSGDTAFERATIFTKSLENNAKLTIGSGSSTVEDLKNNGVLSLDNQTTINTDTLDNSNGTIEAAPTHALRVLMLDPDKSPQTTLHTGPTVRAKVKDEKHSIYPGTLKSKKDLILEMDPCLDIAEFLRRYVDQLQCGGKLRLYGDVFRANNPFTYPGAVLLYVRDFEVNRHLIFRSLGVKAKKARVGTSNDEMGFIETMPDKKNPKADTSFDLTSEEDLDLRYGQVFGHGKTSLTSTRGKVLIGEKVIETRHSFNVWGPGSGNIDYPYYTPNGAFACSNEDMLIKGRNVLLCLAEVRTKARLTLEAEQNVRSLASKIFARGKITINGDTFDHEIFSTYLETPSFNAQYPSAKEQPVNGGWIGEYFQPAPVGGGMGALLRALGHSVGPGYWPLNHSYHTLGHRVPHGSQGHLNYQMYFTYQRSDPASLESLNDIEFNTRGTRSYGSTIRAAGSLIDKKTRRVWDGTGEAGDVCPFIEHESQILPWQGFEDGQGGAWYHYGTGLVLGKAQGRYVEMSAPIFKNSSFLSGHTMKLDAFQAAFQHMGSGAQKTAMALIDMGILSVSVRDYVEPDITTNGFIRRTPDGRVEEIRGTAPSNDELLLEEAQGKARKTYEGSLGYESVSDEVLTHSGGKKYLRVYINPDGDCCFHALGMTRADFLERIGTYIDACEAELSAPGVAERLTKACEVRDLYDPLLTLANTQTPKTAADVTTFKRYDLADWKKTISDSIGSRLNAQKLASLNAAFDGLIAQKASASPNWQVILTHAQSVKALVNAATSDLEKLIDYKEFVQKFGMILDEKRDELNLEIDEDTDLSDVFLSVPAADKKTMIKALYGEREDEEDNEWLDPSFLVHIGKHLGFKAKIFKKEGPSQSIRLDAQTPDADIEGGLPCRSIVHVNNNHYDVLYPLEAQLPIAGTVGLPIVGQMKLGAPAGVQRYLTVNLEMEYFQRMFAGVTGRVHDQDLSGADLFYKLYRNGQEEAAKGTLVTGKPTKTCLAWIFEKIQNVETEEEGLAAVMNLLLSDSLAYEGRSAEVLGHKSLDVTTAVDLHSIAGKFGCTKGDTRVTVGGNCNLLADVETHVGDNHHQTYTPTEFENPDGSAFVYSAKNINAEAPRGRAKNQIVLHAKQSLNEQAVPLYHKSTKYDGDTKTVTEGINHGVADLQTTGAGSSVSIRGEDGRVDMQAPIILTGPGGKTTIRSKKGTHIADVHDKEFVDKTTTEDSGGPCGGTTTTKDVRVTDRSRGATFNNTLEMIIDEDSDAEEAAKADIVLTGADCTRVTKFIGKNKKGKVRFAAGVNDDKHFVSEQSESPLWQSYEHNITSRTWYTPCQFSPTCEFDIQSENPIIVDQVRGQPLAWIGPLQESLNRNGGKLNIHELNEIFSEQHFERQGPTAAAALVIAIAVTAITAGTMAHAGVAVATSAGMATTTTTVTAIGTFTATTLTTAGAFVSVMTTAALASLTTTATMCIFNNFNDPKNIIKDFMRSDTWKAALISAATAAALQGGNQMLGTPSSGAGATAKATEDARKAAMASNPGVMPQMVKPTLAQSVQASIANQAQFHAMSAAANMGADMAINGQSPEKVFKGGTTNAAINALAATAANTVAWGMSVDLLNKFGQFMCHLGIGAGIGAATNGERGALDGAIFAGVAETIANMTREDPSVTNARAREKAKDQGVAPTRQNLSTFVQDELRKTVDIGVLGTSFFALLLEKDVALAHRISRNALENNFAKEELEKCLGFSAIDAYTNKTLDQLQEDEDFVRDASDAAVDEANKSLEERAEKTPIGKAHKAVKDGVKDGVKAGAKAVGLDRLANVVSDHINLDGLRDAASSHADRVGQGASGYAASKIEQVEALRGPLSDEQRSFLQQEFEDHHAEDAFARDMMNGAADGVALLFSLPGKAAEAVLNQTNLTSDATAHALGNLTNDAVALAGGAMAVKQAFKASAAGLGKQTLGKSAPRFHGLAAANANKAPVFMTPSANRNLADAIGHRMQATGTHGPAPSFATRMMEKDDSFLPRSAGGLGRSEGLGTSGVSGAGLGRDAPRPTGPKSSMKHPSSSAPKKEVGFVEQGGPSIPSEYLFESEVFTKQTMWTAPKGTQQTYKIYQRGDIDWNMVRTEGPPIYRGITNGEAAKRWGKAPQLSDGSMATLHHINQNGLGNLAEASTRYHGIGKNPGQNILHGLYGRSKPHPSNPVNRPKFDVDTAEYWKWRADQ